MAENLVRKCDGDCPQFHNIGRDPTCFYRQHFEVQPGAECKYCLPPSQSSQHYSAEDSAQSPTPTQMDAMDGWMPPPKSEGTTWTRYDNAGDKHFSRRQE